jgi:hypothetical protein
VATRGVINGEAIFALCILALAATQCRVKSRINQSKIEPPFCLADFAAIGSAILLILAAYWRTRDLPFLSDDFILLTIGKDLWSQGFGHLFSSGGGDGFFRPLGLMSIGMTWAWAGTDTAQWHVASLGLHCLNTVLVYAWGRCLKLERTWAWFAAMLFAVHAAHPEAVAWIAGRFDLVATAFALAALTAFAVYWERDVKRSSMMWGGAALLAMAGGMLSKESAYAVPVMMTVYAISRAQGWLRALARLLPFYAVTGGLFGYRWAMQGGIGGYTVQGAPQALTFHPLPLANALLVRIWAVLFFPVNWSVGAAWLFGAVIVCGLCWLAVAWRPEGERTAVLMPAALTVASALPAAGLLLIGADLEKARVLYLPSAAFCVLAASLVRMATPKVRVAAAGGLIAFQLLTLEHNLGIWREVASTSAAACEAAVKCSNPEAVSGLPGTLNGVYFFRNGFPECVKLRQAQEKQSDLHVCSLNWDPRSKSIH